jgi:hypothetical protein
LKRCIGPSVDPNYRGSGLLAKPRETARHPCGVVNMGMGRNTWPEARTRALRLAWTATGSGWAGETEDFFTADFAVAMGGAAT